MNIKAFILLLLFIMFTSCQKKQDNFLEDMASLDKAYMDTLLIIRDVNNTDRKAAIEKFIIVWNDFKKNTTILIQKTLNGKPILIACRIY